MGGPVGEISRATISAFAAGTTATLARGGKIEIARIATDAFGNALGSSLAASVNGDGDGRTLPRRSVRDTTSITPIDASGPKFNIPDIFDELSFADHALMNEQLSESLAATPNSTTSTTGNLALTSEQKIELVRAAIPDAISAAANALSSERLTSSERAKLQKAVDALGRTDLNFEVTDLREENTGATAKMSNGRPIITVNTSGRELIKDGIVNRDILATDIAHEGQHVSDFMDYRWSDGPATLADERLTERNAYQVQAIYNKAIGVVQGFAVPDRGIVPLTTENSNVVAELSVKMWADQITAQATESNRNIDLRNARVETEYRDYQRRNRLTGPIPANYIQRRIDVPVYTAPTDLPRR